MYGGPLNFDIFLATAGCVDAVSTQHVQHLAWRHVDGLTSDQQDVAGDRLIGVLADNGVHHVVAECHAPLLIVSRYLWAPAEITPIPATELVRRWIFAPQEVLEARALGC